MSNIHLEKILSPENNTNHHFISLSVSKDKTLKIYPASVNRLENHIFFIAVAENPENSEIVKNLYIVSPENETPAAAFQFEYVGCDLNSGIKIAECPMNHKNALAISELFDFTRPVLIGTENSFGFGDRLGIANPGHLRALSGKTILPILAQQSIRELERTARKPEDVMDAAVWAVFQEGYRDGFGADADHLKTTTDIDFMIRAGFTMFTFDPGDYVVNDVETFSMGELVSKAESISWNDLDDTFENFMNRYEDVRFTVTADFSLAPEREEILRGIVKYGDVIIHTIRMHNHLKDNYPGLPQEIELSVDETDSPTSTFEHFLIASELKRLGIRLVSLAPRFIGEFEKGIDYKGDLDEFRSEYIRHLKISHLLGPYKISLHSGSDKFSVYEVIGKLSEGNFHVKTAGTSYLIALQTIASADNALFREILNYSRDHYDTEKVSYHVSADIKNVPSPENLSDGDLTGLFTQDDAREVMHVTFGKVLTEKTSGGDYLFRDSILKCLNENEEIHYELLKRHFERHIKPFFE
ncbi:tagaturonate epimerase family protein [Candidatus Latescibacterota bacterium]